VIEPRRPRLRALRALTALFVIAVCVHLLAVWALPRVIMTRLLDSVASAESAGVFLPPMTDATQRRVVMPSPDLLYAACRFDLGTQALRIRLEPGEQALWSLALYGANSDNFFILNDRDLRGTPVDLVLLPPGGRSSAQPLPAGARTVLAPTTRGLLLVRLLVSDYERERDRLERARQSLRCEPV